MSLSCEAHRSSRSDGAAAAPEERPSPAWKQQARDRVAEEQQTRDDSREARRLAAHERRESLREQQELREKMVGSRVSRCGSCEACAQLSHFGGEVRHHYDPRWLPCPVLGRLSACCSCETCTRLLVSGGHDLSEPCEKGLCFERQVGHGYIQSGGAAR